MVNWPKEVWLQDFRYGLKHEASIVRLLNFAITSFQSFVDVNYPHNRRVKIVKMSDDAKNHENIVMKRQESTMLLEVSMRFEKCK